MTDDAPHDPVQLRLRAAGDAMARAADAHHPMTAPPSILEARRGTHHGRRLAIAAAIVLVAAGTVLMVVRNADAPPDHVTTSKPDCAMRDDLLALTNDSGGRPGGFPDGFYSVGVDRAGGGQPTYINDVDQVVTEPTFSPDGSQLAVTWADGNYESAGPESESIWIVDTDDGDARPLTTGGYDSDPSWSPDGRWIAYLSRVGNEDDRSLRVIPATGGTPRNVIDLGANYRGGGASWAPGGDQLIAWSNAESSSSLVVADLNGNEHDLATVAGGVWDVTVVPGGTEVLVTYSSPGTDVSRLVAIDLETGEQRGVAGSGVQPRWSRDGQRLYAVSASAVHRARYTGSAVEVLDQIDAGGVDLQVGPCTDPPPTGTRPPHALLDTVWSLGPKQVVIEQDAARPNCDGSSCLPVRISFSDARDQGTACTTITGDLRGTAFVTDEVTGPPSDNASPYCASVEDWQGNPPDQIEVRGDLLRIHTPENDWWREYGALYSE